MRLWIITFFGTGLSPIAPGTVGSIAASVMLFALLRFCDPTTVQWQWILLSGLGLSCVFSVGLGKWAVRHFHRKDPQAFVLDEVAGICLTNLLLPDVSGRTLLLACVAFRLFDITKIPPARQLEKLPAGWGILLDDLAAGVYANILCHLALRFIF